MAIVASSKVKTVVVLGAAYAGHRATELLVQGLPHGWRVVVIERNTHFNHLYAFPRVSVVPGHEHKVFIPYTNLLRTSPSTPTDESEALHPKEEPPEHEFIHAIVTGIEHHTVSFEHLPENSGKRYTPPRTGTVEFDYLIYALGSKLPRPINLWAEEDSLEEPEPWCGTKSEGCDWHRDEQERIKQADSVLVVGGGALGVQYASDIQFIYPNKSVTLVHSGKQLLPRFQKWMHDQAFKKLEELGVKVILESRVDLTSVYDHGNAKTLNKERVVLTLSGKTIPAEYILLCTGQKPNTDLIKDLSPASVNEQNGAAYVTRTMQLAEGDSETLSKYPHIYVAGDAADAFGALKAGHTAWGQAATAVHNILAEIKNDNKESRLSYEPPPPAITVSLGLNAGIYERRGIFGEKPPEECHESLNVHLLWTRRGLPIEDMTI